MFWGIVLATVANISLTQKILVQDISIEICKYLNLVLMKRLKRFRKKKN